MDVARTHTYEAGLDDVLALVGSRDALVGKYEAAGDRDIEVGFAFNEARLAAHRR